MKSAAMAICAALLTFGTSTMATAADVLARVNGEAITQDDLDFELMLNGLKGNQPAHIKQRKLEHLIERELVLQHLTKLGIKPDSKLIALQINRVKNIVQDAGLDPDKVLKERGFTDAKLRIFFSSFVLWKQFTSNTITEAKLKAAFEERKKQFDGTEYRASQIYLKLPEKVTPADVAEAKRKLLDFKSQIEQGKISFADAAKKWSQSPSAENGGDLGFFLYSSPLPTSMSSQAFQIEQGKIGQPFQTSFGMHLMTVTDIRPGQFVLEDVRDIVRSKLELEEWAKLVPDLKQKAKIEYVK